MSIKTYSELMTFSNFKDRFDYLKIRGLIGEDTFGFDRVFNQRFYNSREWKRIRDKVLIRDNFCDLGCYGYNIGQYDKIIVHHMNPISLSDIENHTDILLNPEFLITTIASTHNAIHYGDYELINKVPIERTKNDTCPWRR